MFARVTAVFAVKESALLVPEEAIVPQGGRQFVIKVVPPSAVPGTATAALSPDVRTVSQRQEVKLGIRRPGRVEVLEGLVAGETVVVAGQQRLQRDGTPVRVQETGRGPGGGGGRPGGSGGAGAPAPVAGAGASGAAPAATPGASAAAAAPAASAR
jgi:membrane fusion protein (multidrug efflux system)